MLPHAVDRNRAARLLSAAGLDALVVAEPEAFMYVTGLSQGVPGLFRRAGAGFAVLPADPAEPLGLVTGDLYAAAARARFPDAGSHPLWMENADLTGTDEEPIEQRIRAGWRRAGRHPGFARPATFDLGASLAALRTVLAARGLTGGRLGFDLDFIAASDAETIRAAFPNPPVQNGSPVMDRLRMVKTPGEIERLALGVALAEAGLRHMQAGVALGHAASDLHALFRAGIEDEAARRSLPAPPSWDYIAIGPDPWRADGRVGDGSVIKADVGCVIDGYSSDTSRNYVFGSASEDQARLHAMLENAFDAGFAEIRSGRPMAAAHQAATRALHAAGLEGFSRGHLGHGLGHSLFSEQWPFIAAETTIPFEPDMVVAFEIPIYVTGLGGFNLEDQILVTAEGARSMNTLSRRLVSLGGG